MLLTVKVKLIPGMEQRCILLQTMERFNQACDKVSAIAFRDHCFSKFLLQKFVYHGIREEFGLSAQLTIRCISKVVESYKTDFTNIKERNKKKRKDELKEELRQHEFRPHSSIVYDQRILSWKGIEKVSLTTLKGRAIIPIVLGGKYAELDLNLAKGQADLIYVDKQFYLCVVVEVSEETPLTPEGYLGVDLGQINLATDSDRNIYSGKNCEKVRKRYGGLKSRLQSVGSKSAKKHLVKVSKKESRFKCNDNHCISKALVSLAKDTKRAIVLEDLTHINSRTTVRSEQRDSRTKWAFRQLRSFIEYKAKLVGVPVLFVDPAYTSQMCSVCGYSDKDNRKSQKAFVCLKCGYAENADINAAYNIRTWAAISQPIVVRPADQHDFGTANQRIYSLVADHFPSTRQNSGDSTTGGSSIVPTATFSLS